MRTLPVVFAALATALCSASQLALMVLEPAGAEGSAPPGWQIKLNHGKPDIATVAEAGGAALRLRSNRASFALERSVDVDPGKMPLLSWRWKVTQLPAGADFRRSGTDDQAAQVLVAFADRKIVSYIWDTTAPKGTAQSVGFIPLLRIFAVVCQSGAASLNQWVAEERNIAADYERAYGKSAPRVKGLRLQINSQHTGTRAESYFAEVGFRAIAQ